MNISLLVKLLNFYPPYLGTGIRIKSVDKQITDINVEMKLRFYNQNIKGVHFGGSLYAMCDPWYMFIIGNYLGDNYVVWDKGAQIRFRRPGTGTVKARFHISEEQLKEIKRKIDEENTRDFHFTTEVLDKNNKVVCTVKKVVYANTSASHKKHLSRFAK